MRIQNLNNSNAPFNYYRGELPEKFAVNDGELLFAWSGTPGTSFGAHIWRGGRAWLNQHIFKVLFDRDQFDTRFLQLAINQNLATYIRAAHGGAGLAHITKGRFEESGLPCPLIAEQRRIVAEIEKQLTRLDAGVSALKSVQANLRRFRTVIFNDATEGRLMITEAALARRERRTSVPANKLRQLALRDKTARNENASDVPHNLPMGWAWSTLGELLREPLRNGHSAKISPDGSGLRAFTLTAVTEGDFSQRNTKPTVASREKVKDLWAEPGDIYVERSNTPELVGTARLYRGPSGFAFIPDLLIRVRLKPMISAEYVEICLRSERIRRFLRSRAQGISGSMPKIDQDAVSSVLIPLPPAEEQRRIVVEVERRLGIVDELEHFVKVSLRRAKNLRQAILQRAFAGNLKQL